ncbi:heparan-alpha-glucosaminide N-acetyltransferase domain-containing protein [Aeromicrobium sp.]|uniref:DUF418 domain-containing protein n=1 Tax=Aeromicrobium sp. TaxID=1871063 RepID=UPI0025BF9BBF|nr:heparan-alpha-glucosaminide N-acetyltransferase domain-containing protein [Aeromicrobium sp.]MCK5892482.1 DUF418 domain-containing protein [Aeromicrobium sp.]
MTGLREGAGRLVGIDLARAVALLGMMLAHLGPPWTGFGAPPVSDWLAAGRAAPLFAVLAGLSVGLMVRLDPDGVGSRTAVVRRAVVLLVIGLGLAALPDLTILVILPCYAVLIAATVLVRALSTRVLLGLATAWCLLSPAALFAVRHVVDEPVRSVIQPSFGGGLDELPVSLLVWGGYPAIVWFGYVLVGLSVARLDLRSAVVVRRLVVGGAVVTAAALWTAASALYLGVFRDAAGDPRFEQLFVARSAYDPLDPSWFWAAGQHTSTPLNVVGAAGSAVLVVGLCLWLCRSARGARLVSPLRAAGSMTLTLYVMHVVMTWANRELDASFTTGYYREWWIQVVLLVTLAWLWRLITPRGPLETLVRWCSLARPHLPHRPRATRRT